ncbi:ROK family protein [Paracoccus sp. (in: a-proteobacteria)]|uniref:ROK family protein n=1 Tax=Paracoccus sp. TaxID=267 RepID=UPI003A8A2519
MSGCIPDPHGAISAGIDLGGTKIEAALFGPDATPLTARRRPTPRASYEALLDALVQEVEGLRSASGRDDLPVGIGMPGLVDAQTGVAVTANLPANGQRLAHDLAARAGGHIVTANDCKCFALSEANGGAGQGYGRVFGLILGTGLGGGLCQDGRLVLGHNGLPGEIGHYGLPAHLIQRHGLPLLPCGCGRTGCTETLISGTGMAQLARAILGIDRSAPEIAATPDDPGNARVLQIWTELAAELLHTIQLHIDPDCIVLGGGLSRIGGLAPRLAGGLTRAALPSLRQPAILTPRFGDSSGTRGAAILALHSDKDRTR